MNRIALAVTLSWMIGAAASARGDGTHLRWGDDLGKKPEPTLAEGVPLEWRPNTGTERLRAHAIRAFQGKKVEVKLIGDGRSDSRLIGENNEGRKPKPVRTTTDVGAWCTERLTAALSQAGVAVVGESPDAVITGKVTRFMVDERDEYRAIVSLDLTVSDGAGKPIWSGEVVGEAKVFGRSYSAVNYMEVLSDSLIQAYDELFIRVAP